MKGYTPGRIIAAAVGALIAFYVVDRIVGYVTGALSSQAAGKDVLAQLAANPLLPFGNPLQLDTSLPALLSGATAAAAVVLAVIYRVSGRQTTRPGEEQGSAEWGTRLPRRFRGTGAGQQLRFTQTEAMSTDTHQTKRNLNVLVLGASGSRKTRSYVMPNLRTLEASTATTDPKGEIIREIRPTLEARGIAVRTLNLIDLGASGKFNPLRYVSPDEPETGLAQLTETIIANTTGEKEGGGDGFWERAERALLTALTAYVWATTAQTDTTEPNLPGVLDLQKGMQGSEENKDAMTSETDLRFQAAREIVTEWHSNPNPDDDPAVIKVLDFACRQYRIYEQGPAETRMSVVISLGVRLAPLDMHDVRNILTTDDLAIDKIGYERTALFLQIPDTHRTFKFISAMFWQTLFSLTVYQADHEETGHLPELLHMFLDEFANIGKIPAFEQVMATIRSRGISASIIMQSRSQGKTLFGDAWAGVENNCDTKLFLGGDEEETTKWVSGLLGYQTIVTPEISESRGSHGSWSKSMRVTKRELMMPDEIGRLPDDEAILKIRGMSPFRSKKLAI
ncbi:type IV secretory system conjugative DNA transfer family protein (plasmid) [Leifsonia sp. ZF2019]|uniref:VirD4-like conjugal transfer protein, CD1115 family n=1 Tax=Leifsonia sp. ZF2019 TaxID=2781978 RepID=UPI001CBBDF14|nr:type IV secretory system conjugative DNA transfer family protein [Leifsonia sp. ZF2019]UAJ81710.1 type IV secretory system conjugative DNA transfer family protein [Leifsonia sp. ZF2019]